MQHPATTTDPASSKPARKQKRALKDNRTQYRKPANHQAHIAQIAQTNINSCTAVEHLMDGAHARLFGFNQRLLEIHHELRECQLKYELAVELDHASIALELYNCGKGCLGCPHPRWLRYHWTEVQLTLENPEHKFKAVGRPINSPVQAIPRKAKNRTLLLSLVREAQHIIKERAKLLKLFSKLRAFAE